MRDSILKTLREIDRVEAEMRRLEARLTRVREHLHRDLLGGKFSPYDADGISKKEKAERARQPAPEL